MTEKQILDEQTKQDIGDASVKQIKMITKMIIEYARALNGGTINSTEMMLLGTNVISAGWAIISRSNDYDGLDVDTRIAVIKAIKASVDSVVEKVYLNPEVVAQQVAKAALESASRDPKLKSFKGTK